MDIVGIGQKSLSCCYIFRLLIVSGNRPDPFIYDIRIAIRERICTQFSISASRFVEKVDYFFSVWFDALQNIHQFVSCFKPRRADLIA